jgi:hypothetical protein
MQNATVHNKTYFYRFTKMKELAVYIYKGGQSNMNTMQYSYILFVLYLQHQ